MFSLARPSHSVLSLSHFSVWLLTHLLQVEDLVLHFLQCSEQFSLTQPGLFQLGLQIAHELLCVLRQILLVSLRYMTYRYTYWKWDLIPTLNIFL